MGDTDCRWLGMLAAHVTPADEQDRDQVERLAAAGQGATGESVEIGYVDKGYTGQTPAEKAAAHGIQLIVVKRPQAKPGLCAAAAALGGRAILRLDHPL